MSKKLSEAEYCERRLGETISAVDVIAHGEFAYRSRRSAVAEVAQLDAMRDGIVAALSDKKRTKRAKGKRVRVKGMLEIVVENDLVTNVEGYDGMAEKFMSPGRRDVPDRLITEGPRGWDRAAHLLRDVLKEERRAAATGVLYTHDELKNIVRQIVAQMIYMVECKAPGKKPNKRQRLDHARRRAAGITVRVYDGEWQE